MVNQVEFAMENASLALGLKVELTALASRPLLVACLTASLMAAPRALTWEIGAVIGAGLPSDTD